MRSNHAEGRKRISRAGSLPPTTYINGLRPIVYSLPSSGSRRGISLLEVLISMFVLLVGLVGVMALIPAGRFQIMKGSQDDHGSMVGRSVWRDLQIRGYLNPTNWLTSAGVAIYSPTSVPPFSVASITNPSNPLTPAIAIDPLGLFAPTSFGTTFPYGAATPLMLTRIVPHANASSFQLADPIFRSGDDLLFTTSGNSLPPVQQPVPFGAAAGSVLKRASDGNYSWLATIVTDPNSNALSSTVTVSVAVFFKRDLSNPANPNPVTAPEVATMRAIAMPGRGFGGGDVVLFDPTVTPPTTNMKPVKPGQWIMLAGSTFSGTAQLNYFRWYKVTAASEVQNTSTNPWAGAALPTDVPTSGSQLQTATLQGPDWIAFPAASANQKLLTPTPGVSPWPYAWVIDNVIAVYEKNLRLEIQ